ncbi:MAG: phospholipase D-like domain-containing protein [Candidatus Sericytochromatia bacterium]|nr:phospholipase D-like domain-containing protein [Candidatus Sericytochromatia bacterium]
MSAGPQGVPARVARIGDYRSIASRVGPASPASDGARPLPPVPPAVYRADVYAGPATLWSQAPAQPAPPSLPPARQAPPPPAAWPLPPATPPASPAWPPVPPPLSWPIAPPPSPPAVQPPAAWPMQPVGPALPGGWPAQATTPSTWAAWPVTPPRPVTAPAGQPQVGSLESLWQRVREWLRRIFGPPTPLPPQPAPPTPGPQPPSPGPVPPNPAPPGQVTPGVSVHFTQTYASPRQGLTNEQVRQRNEATARAHPDNPDQRLVALIDAVPAGGTLDGAFFSIGVENVTAAFIRAAQRGVRVRLVTEKDYYQDRLGAPRPAIARLLAAGIQVVPDDRGALMHNKFLVANGSTVWTGSYNVTESGSYHENNNAMRIESPELASVYSHEFEKMFNWRNFGPDRPDNATPWDDHPAPRRIQLGQAEVIPFFSPYLATQGGARQALLDELAQARQRIEFLAFSFTDDAIADAMLARAAAGVTVQGVFEKGQAASRYSEYQRMNPRESELAGRLDVRLDTNPSLMHHKVILIDDSTLVMGSFNFSDSAQSDNAENMLIFRNAPDLVARYREEFQRIQAIADS